ncbi:MAG TPA: T9SS type A sorting domain-containing protein [Adhaeribacter sp.]|nr:T9SS type A sorting domain-containing protein [Adhaeribacter sp.]
MKRTLLSALAALSLSVCVAQVVQPQNPPATVVGSYNQSGPLAATFAVVNTSSQAENIVVARKMISEVPGSENNFCWGVNCYPPNVSVSPDAETIPANGTNSSFIADYTPNNQQGITVIRYSFFREFGTPDSAHVTITFDASSAVASTRKNIDHSEMIGMPSPNPANSITSIPFNVPLSARSSKLRIMNAIGGIVKEVELPKKQGNAIVVTSDLQSGIYFYNLQIDGNSVATKKLIVRH